MRTTVLTLVAATLAGCGSTYADLAASDYTHRAHIIAAQRCTPQIRERPDLGPLFYEVRGCSAGDLVYSCSDDNDRPSCRPVRPVCPTAALLR